MKGEKQLRQAVRVNMTGVSGQGLRFLRNGLQPTQHGGIAAHAALANMDFVDASRLGISEHSMGT